MTTPDGERIDIIKDGKLVEGVTQIFWKRGNGPEQPAAVGGKERLG